VGGEIFRKDRSFATASTAGLTEPKQEKEKRVTEGDPLAKRPAMAIAYHMPERNTPEYYAMGLIDQILVEATTALCIKSWCKNAA